MTRRRGKGARDPEWDPHGVSSAESGVIICMCGERFAGRSTGDSWDMYYDHWAFWGGKVKP